LVQQTQHSAQENAHQKVLRQYKPNVGWTILLDAECGPFLFLCQLRFSGGGDEFLMVNYLLMVMIIC
jgi:hypothetical protein